MIIVVIIIVIVGIIGVTVIDGFVVAAMFRV